MPKLSEIRAQYPMYDGVSDEQLLIGLHKKFYADMPFKDFNKAIVYDNKPSATDGMSNFEKFRAGFGKSIADMGQGLGQYVGLSDRADVSESRKLNADLMKTGWGKAGDITGNVVTTLPAAFLPGANTVKGASLIGALTGLAQPSESTTETLGNAGLGGALGGGGVMLGRGIAAGYQGASGLIRPLTQKGQEQIAAEVLQASATNAPKALLNASKARELVPGSKSTFGQVADDAGLAQLERTLYNNAEAQGPLARAYQAQSDARRKAIADIAGVPGYLDSLKQGRSIFAREDYAAARNAGIDTDMAAALQPQIDSLLRRPTMKKLAEDAKLMAADKDIALTDVGSIDGMHWMKKALDRKITGATNPASATHDQLGSLNTMKSDLMATLEQISPLYKTANDNFAKSSKNINAMEVAQNLQKRLYKNANWGSQKETMGVYQTELTNVLDSVKKQTGMNKSLSDVMPTRDIATLEGIAYDLSRKEAVQNLGTATGSPTMQNMMGQNLINRIAGPLGAPQSFSENVIANTLARPVDFMMKSAQPRVAGLLGEAMADPATAQRLLSLTRDPSKLGLLGLELEKFAGLPGLMALESRQ